MQMNGKQLFYRGFHFAVAFGHWDAFVGMDCNFYERIILIDGLLSLKSGWLDVKGLFGVEFNHLLVLCSESFKYDVQHFWREGLEWSGVVKRIFLLWKTWGGHPNFVGHYFRMSPYTIVWIDMKAINKFGTVTWELNWIIKLTSPQRIITIKSLIFIILIILPQQLIFKPFIIPSDPQTKT